MGNHNRLWSLRGAVILCMATTASALSLSNFQLITSAQVPLGCILAYNKPIPSCTNADFTRGNGCSQECAEAIYRVQYTLQNVCGDGDGSSSSILGQAMQGTLVDVLCPASAGLPTTTSSTTISKLTLTQVVPPRTTLTTERSNSPTLTPTSSSTTETPRASDIPESPPSQAVPPQQTGTSVAPLVPSQTTGGQQTTSPAAPPSVLGAGSPFDDPILNASPRRFDMHWLAMSLSVFAMGMMVMR